MKLHIRRVFYAAVSVGLALVVLAIVALWTTIDRARESSGRVVHSYRVIDSVDLLGSAAIQLEAAQRGLLVSGIPQFARERDEAVERLTSGVSELRRLTSENEEQQPRFDLLAAQIAERVRLAGLNEKATRDGLATSRAAVESPAVRQAAAAIAATISQIRDAERKILQQRRAREAGFHERTQAVLISAVLGGGFLMAIIFWAYRRQALLHEAVELRLRDLVQALPVSLWQLRAGAGDGMSFEFISDNAQNLRHIDLDAARRAHAAVMVNIHPEDRPGVEVALRCSAETLGPLDVQYRIATDAGEQRWIHSRAAPRREANGTVLWSGYWADITEELEVKRALQTATQEAVQANAAKSAFLAAMSHEIRTPMNGVLGLLELLSMSRLDEEQRSTLSVVRESGRSLLRIVDDILDFSKIEANKLSLHPVPASVAHLVQSTCHIHSSLASGKGLLLQARVDPRISPTLFFDPQRLGQILNNLVSNALKFTERGSVVIEARLLARGDDSEQLAFIVSDTGVGVAAQDLEHLFQPFAQSGGANAGRVGGTGLGLVISRRLAEMMGGSIEMQSEPGRGTTVTLHCEFAPATDAQASAPGLAGDSPAPFAHILPTRAAPTREYAEREGTLILVVDDHPVNRMVMRRQVNSLGYAAEVAADGQQAYEAWRTGRFGLVLADCNMPVMSGYELARAIRAHELACGLPRTPVLACTANALASQAAACEEAGMDAWLVKPCGLQTLSEQLARWLPQPVSGTHQAEVQEPPIDEGLLDAVTGGDEAVRADMLADFRRANDEDAALLRAAVARSELAQVLVSAHRMKGACLCLGAAGLGEACSRIEQAARSGSVAHMAELMQVFEQQFACLSAHLDAGESARATGLVSD